MPILHPCRNLIQGRHGGPRRGAIRPQRLWVRPEEGRVVDVYPNDQHLFFGAWSMDIPCSQTRQLLRDLSIMGVSTPPIFPPFGIFNRL